VSKIESFLLKMPGVISAAVNISTNRCVVKFNCKIVGPRDIMSGLGDLGYPATLSKDALDEHEMKRVREQEVGGLRRLFFIALALSSPVLCIHMLLMNIAYFHDMLMTQVSGNVTLEDLLMFIFVTPTHFYCGWKFHLNAFRGLKRCSMGMDFLVSFGTNCAYFYSLYSIIFGFIHPGYRGHSFFETSGVLITFVLLGKYMEAVAKGRTSEALTKLVRSLTFSVINLLF
jgi:Cu+-exporting ATPase